MGLVAHEHPESIEIWEQEADLLHDELDFDYIDGVAFDVALSLDGGVVAEVCYQPGDMTRYGLLFVPTTATARARERAPGWGTSAISGVGRDRGDVVVVWLEHSAYPIRLANRQRDLAAGYVNSHWDAPGASAVSLAVLFRAVAWHLDRIPMAKPL